MATPKGGGFPFFHFFKIIFLSFIYLYFEYIYIFFIKSDMCRYLIGANVAPNIICQIF
jgi:hypothetical protein